jgi:hypothetical protein
MGQNEVSAKELIERMEKFIDEDVNKFKIMFHELMRRYHGFCIALISKSLYKEAIDMLKKEKADFEKLHSIIKRDIDRYSTIYELFNKEEAELRKTFLNTALSETMTEYNEYFNSKIKELIENAKNFVDDDPF